MLVPAYGDFFEDYMGNTNKVQCKAYNKHSELIVIIIIINFENKKKS